MMQTLSLATGQGVIKDRPSIVGSHTRGHLKPRGESLLVENPTVLLLPRPPGLAGKRSYLPQMEASGFSRQLSKCSNILSYDLKKAERRIELGVAGVFSS